MSHLTALWSRLGMRRRIIVIGATVAMFAAILALSRVAGAPDMALLYAGLKSGPAGEVVEALEARGVAHEVRGGNIYVPRARRDELRMRLASDGLPATGGAGYELLDSLSGFGTTSQMFDAAYWRAKEGELARTIVAGDGIETARVHIARNTGDPFRRRVAPSASVAVTGASGRIGSERAEALRFLVASAVSGMEPENVSVIGGDGRLIRSPGADAPPGGGGDARAARLKRNVERLLEARVGPGNAVVEVNVETRTDRESITERRIDPESRVPISSQTTETKTQSKNAADGDVTVASNLPSGDSEGGGGSSRQDTETRERVNYEVSETRREIERAPGALTRLSVAVLVDGIRTTDSAGEKTWQPRPEDELSALRDLVKSAVGYDAERGDLLTLKTMEFRPPARSGTTAKAPVGWPGRLNPMTLIQIGVLALVTLALGVFVVRPVLTDRRKGQGAPALPEPDREDAGSGTDRASRAATAALAPPDGVDPADNRDVGTAVARAQGAGDPVGRLRRLIEERQDETVEILRGWMTDRSGGA